MVGLNGVLSDQTSREMLAVPGLDAAQMAGAFMLPQANVEAAMQPNQWHSIGLIQPAGVVDAFVPYPNSGASAPAAPRSSLVLADELQALQVLQDSLLGAP